MHGLFRVAGLDCAEEVALLRSALEGQPGVRELGFDLLRQRLHVDYDQGTSADAICRAVAATGLSAEPLAPGATRAAADEAEEGARAPSGAARAPRRRLSRRQVGTVLSAAALGTGFLVHLADGGLAAALAGEAPPRGVSFAYLAATLAALGPLLPRSLAAARRLAPDMHLLMALAVLGALALGEWFEAATVALLFELSLRLEAASTARARRAVEALLDRSPPVACRLTVGADGESPHEQLVSAAEVRAGDRLLVRPGQRVPVDGQVRAGRSEVDESLLTGESRPVERGVGDTLVAGSVNGSGALELEASGGAADSTLARVAQLVEVAATRRSPVEQLVERFARIYTPVVVLAALLLAVLPPLVSQRSFADAVYDALVLLVIACPCALVLSAPVAVACALASAARQGVLVKGGAFLEAAAAIRCMAFDKTGTLTAGRPQLQQVFASEGHTSDEVLAGAAAVEVRSTHPLAGAIVTAARAAGLQFEPASGTRERPGRGAEGLVEGALLWVGSHRLLLERGQQTPALAAQIEALEQQGRTVVVVGREREVCGLLVLGDEPRAGAAEALAELRALGAGPLVLLTGDNAGTAEALARRLGLEDVRAGLLPDEKLAAIEALAARHGRVAMVGDGINDAPALARADLGLALAGGGRDLALESADIVLLTPQLQRLPWLVRHARRLLATLRVNIALAVGVKVVFFALAASGQATLWSAIAADMGVSLLVVLNGMRLLTPRAG